MVWICLCMYFVKKYWEMIMRNQVRSLDIWRESSGIQRQRMIFVFVISRPKNHTAYILN